MPVGVLIRYDEQGLAIHARVSFLRLRLVPKQEKAPKKIRRKKSKKVSGKSKDREKPKKGGTLERFKPLIPVALELANDFRKKLVVDKLELCAWVGGTDPCTIGINYGRAWAAIGCLVPVLENVVTIRSRDLRAELSQGQEAFTISAYLSLHLRLYQLLRLIRHHGIRAVRVLRTKQKQKQPAGQAA